MFVDTLFPEKYAYGATASDDWLTEIVQTLNNREYRNAPNAHPRRYWDLSHLGRTQAEKEDIHRIFMAVRGQKHSFPFKDFADFQCPRNAIGTGDGTTTQFQLVKRYTFGSETYVRPVTKPVLESVVVWVAGVQQASGYTVSRQTGVVSFTNPPAGAALVEASFEYHVPVRFAQPRMSWRAVDRNPTDGLIYECDNLALVEVISE